MAFGRPEQSNTGKSTPPEAPKEAVAGTAPRLTTKPPRKDSGVWSAVVSAREQITNIFGEAKKGSNGGKAA